MEARRSTRVLASPRYACKCSYPRTARSLPMTRDPGIVSVKCQSFLHLETSQQLTMPSPARPRGCRLCLLPVVEMTSFNDYPATAGLGRTRRRPISRPAHAWHRATVTARSGFLAAFAHKAARTAHAYAAPGLPARSCRGARRHLELRELGGRAAEERPRMGSRVVPRLRTLRATIAQHERLDGIHGRTSHGRLTSVRGVEAAP
jgi:hypothetical protein